MIFMARIDTALMGDSDGAARKGLDIGNRVPAQDRRTPQGRSDDDVQLSLPRAGHDRDAAGEQGRGARTAHPGPQGLGVALLLLFTSPAWGFDYWECVLERMPGTANDVVARRVSYDCQKEYPVKEDPPKKTGWLQP